MPKSARIRAHDSILAELLAAEYGLSGSITGLGGENDNFLVVDGAGGRRVLKLNGDQQSTRTLELEDLATESLSGSGLGLPRFVRTLGGGLEARYRQGDREVRGRLLEFVDGTPWCGLSSVSSALRRDLGGRLAQIANTLSGIDVDGRFRTHRWDLATATNHRPAIARIEDASRRRVLERAFLLFAANARPVLDDLPCSLLHGDLNDENLLVEGDRVVGLLDFGDCLVNPPIVELAICLAYVLLGEPDPMAAGSEVVSAYQEVRPLSAQELEILFPLICGRLAASVCIAAERREVDAEREDWFVTEERAWASLELYAELAPLEAAERLSSGIETAVFADRAAPSAPVLARRKERFSSALSLTYEEPIKFSRGRGQFLFDELERPHLDIYNNVCHVGHCHPRVVEAGARQMARLNTNSRYLFDQSVEYADRLCALMPPSLTRCFFVNSGSEANELALRLARAHTGRRDMLVVDGAYHGHTAAMTDLSPYKFLGPGGSGRPEDWVHVVPVADGYRGRFKGLGRQTGLAYAAEVESTIASAERPIAGFITESLLSCAGQVIPPEGYLEAVFEHVRTAGGVCIADEVQVGFGRIGTHFWGFEFSNVVPDIVVLGKPIGNGHPMAAVVTTDAIADSLARAGMEFFSTFGGNPVSCAIGTAVLDVVAEEGLQERALDVGSHLRDQLSGLADRHGLVGDVRGMGLFLGIELVRDRKTLEPAPEETRKFVNELRRRGILSGIDGPHHNVVKIKGPMVITKADADMVARVSDDVLAEMG